MDSIEYHSTLAALAWQVELGADEAICDAPLNRYELADKPAPKPKPAAPVAAPVVSRADIDPVTEARKAAAAAADLEALRAAMGAFEHCSLKAGARNLVFADGTAGAKCGDQLSLLYAPGQQPHAGVSAAVQ